MKTVFEILLIALLLTLVQFVADALSRASVTDDPNVMIWLGTPLGVGLFIACLLWAFLRRG